MAIAKRTKEDVLETSNKFGVNLVRFLYVDFCNMVRSKSTSLPRLKDRIDSGIGLVKGQLAMNSLDKPQSDTGLGAVGEVRMVPDLDTFTVLPYVGTTAAAICDLIELDKKPWALCPRSLLKKVIAEADEMGVSIQAAFETEFYIGNKDYDGRFVPIDTSICFGTDGMNRASKFVSKLVDYLHRQRLQVEQYYAELGHGQHEVSITHQPALTAADQYVLLRETLRGLALEQDVLITCAPKPFEEQPGSGCHVHLSLWDRFGERNMLWADEGMLSEFGLHFVAGIVEHLPGLLALTAPSVNSYRRLKPKNWASAYKCWGYENREAAVRIPSVYWNHEMASSNIEVKCVDGTANPYLALACIIAAGLDGVRKKLKPPAPVSVDPADLTDDERAELGIVRLPDSLHQALVELEADVFLMKTLGEELANAYIIVKSSEAQAFELDSDFELTHHRMRY
ncbi:MAG: glutamine synthetase family protein [Candidatus Melainabacteria bacterium]|nr:glutamine synthetase family protein [Candidatus Melainabacteria bacterium]